MPATSARKSQDAATIMAGLLSLLRALDGLPVDSLASAAYIAALRRRGEDLAAVGGIAALREARTAAIAAMPAHAEVRASLIDAAWTSVPGWTA